MIDNKMDENLYAVVESHGPYEFLNKLLNLLLDMNELSGMEKIGRCFSLKKGLESVYDNDAVRIYHNVCLEREETPEGKAQFDQKFVCL